MEHHGIKGEARHTLFRGSPWSCLPQIRATQPPHTKTQCPNAMEIDCIIMLQYYVCEKPFCCCQILTLSLWFVAVVYYLSPSLAYYNSCTTTACSCWLRSCHKYGLSSFLLWYTRPQKCPLLLREQLANVYWLAPTLCSLNVHYNYTH